MKKNEILKHKTVLKVAISSVVIVSILPFTIIPDYSFYDWFMLFIFFSFLMSMALALSNGVSFILRVLYASYSMLNYSLFHTLVNIDTGVYIKDKLFTNGYEYVEYIKYSGIVFLVCLSLVILAKRIK
jgi:hypothetical protein